MGARPPLQFQLGGAREPSRGATRTEGLQLAFFWFEFAVSPSRTFHISLALLRNGHAVGGHCLARGWTFEFAQWRARAQSDNTLLCKCRRRRRRRRSR